MNPHFEWPSESWQAQARTALEQAQAELWQRDSVLSYLHTVRGLSSATIEQHGLGYLPPEASGHRFGDYWMPGGIVIPWVRERKLVQLRVRCHVGNFAQHLGIREDHTPDGSVRDKYMTMSGGKAMWHLWGVDDLKPSGFVLVTEGEFDAMIALQHLTDYEDDLSVVTIGAANNRFDDSFIEQVSNGRYWVLVATDRDPAGSVSGAALIAQLGDPQREAILERIKRVNPVSWPKNQVDAIAQLRRLHPYRDIIHDYSLVGMEYHWLKKYVDHTPIAARALVPEGKDITDYVVSGGDLAQWYLDQRRERFGLVQDLDSQHYQYYQLMHGKVARLKIAQRELAQHRLELPPRYPSLTSIMAEAEGWLEQYKNGRATIREYARVDLIIDEWLEVAVFALVERLEHVEAR